MTLKTAYLTLVRPIMEYAAPVWDLFYNYTDIYKLDEEMKYKEELLDGFYPNTQELRTSVTSLLSFLNLPTLQQRRKLSRLTLFYKIINNALPIFIPSHYQRTQFSTRQHHSNQFILPQVTLNVYKYSFYPRTIREWNNLPINTIESRDLNEFTYLLINNN